MKIPNAWFLAENLLGALAGNLAGSAPAGFPPLCQLGRKPPLSQSPLSPAKTAPSRLSRCLSSYMLTKKKCQILRTPVLRCTKPYASHRVLRHGAQPLPVASSHSSKGPQAPMVPQGGNKALLLGTSLAAEGRCRSALMPITGSQAPLSCNKVREHIFFSHYPFTSSLLTISLIDFT